MHLLEFRSCFPDSRDDILEWHTAVRTLAVYSQCPQSQVNRQCLAVTVQCTVPLL